jgi:hypothetical protein
MLAERTGRKRDEQNERKAKRGERTDGNKKKKDVSSEWHSNHAGNAFTFRWDGSTSLVKGP